jgi:hypothetical protein
MQRVGSIQKYQNLNAQNKIFITGSGSAVRYFASLPQVVTIDAGNPVLIKNEANRFLTSPQALDGTGHVTGTVTGPDTMTPLAGINVSAYRYDVSRWIVENTAVTAPDGSYDIDSLPFASYKVLFEDPAGTYVQEYYNDKRTFDDADFISVFEGQTVPDINASLAQAGFISGSVVQEAGGSPIEDIVVTAYYTSTGSWHSAPSGLTDSEGSYLIDGLLPGRYRVRFSDIYSPPRYVDEYFDDVFDIQDALDITVTASLTTTGINAALAPYGKIAGTVYGPDGLIPVDQIMIDVYAYNESWLDWEWVSYGETGSDGSYLVDGLLTDDFRVEFSDPLAQLETESYNGQPNISSGDDVPVILGETTSGINATLEYKSMTKNFQIAPDWNLISSPLMASEHISVTLESLNGNYEIAWAYEGCDTSDQWKKYNPSDPPYTNDLTAMETDNGYWLQGYITDTLTVSGFQALSTTITLCPGWNLIGYPSPNSEKVTTVLLPIEGKYDLVYTYDGFDINDPWKSYTPGAPPQLNDLKKMDPGYGYWIHMTEAGTLAIPGR